VIEIEPGLDRTAEQKNWELSLDCSNAPVRLFWVDGLKLRQILVNFVANAIKCTDAGSITLGVDSALVDNGKARLRMEVQDTRIGIAPNAQERTFDPFVQLSQPNARNGSGLRLPICGPFAQMI
jgi:signal transduction histidine kinase